MLGGYNDWVESYGLDDWSWDKVELYFRSIESVVEVDRDFLWGS